MAKSPAKPSSYESAIEELEAIVQDLQDSVVQIDDLTKKSKRAAALIRYCREKLRNAEGELEELFED